MVRTLAGDGTRVVAPSTCAGPTAHDLPVLLDKLLRGAADIEGRIIGPSGLGHAAALRGSHGDRTCTGGKRFPGAFAAPRKGFEAVKRTLDSSPF